MAEKQDLQGVIDKLNTAVVEMRTHNDKKFDEIEKRGEATSLTQTSVDKAIEDIASIREDLKRVETEFNKSKIPDKADETRDEKKEFAARSFDKFIRYGEVKLDETEKRALMSIKDSKGGFFIPEDIESGIQMNAYDVGSLEKYCRIKTTSRDAVKKPVMSQPTMAFGDLQGIAITETALTAGQEMVPVNRALSLYLIENDELEDSDANIIQQITIGCGKSLAAVTDAAIAAGTGAKEPEGVITNTAVLARYVFSGVTAALSDSTNNGFDAIKACFMGVKAVYRSARGSVWAMNSATALAVMQLKNSEGVYYWEPSQTVGAPDIILARPIAYAEGMPDIGANAYPIVFGDFDGYMLLKRKELTVKRNEQKWMDYDRTGIFVKARLGGGVTLSEAFCPLKIATS